MPAPAGHHDPQWDILCSIDDALAADIQKRNALPENKVTPPSRPSCPSSVGHDSDSDRSPRAEHEGEGKAAPAAAGGEAEDAQDPPSLVYDALVDRLVDDVLNEDGQVREHEDSTDAHSVLVQEPVPCPAVQPDMDEKQRRDEIFRAGVAHALGMQRQMQLWQQRNIMLGAAPMMPQVTPQIPAPRPAPQPAHNLAAASQPHPGGVVYGVLVPTDTQHPKPVSAPPPTAPRQTYGGRGGDDAAGSPGRRYEGVVKSFVEETGFGFITCAEILQEYGCDVFLHKTQLMNCRAQMDGNTINRNLPVEFTVSFNKQGKPQARNVRPLRSSPQQHRHSAQGPTAAQNGGVKKPAYHMQRPQQNPSLRRNEMPTNRAPWRSPDTAHREAGGASAYTSM